MTNTIEMNQFSPFGYPELLRRQSSQYSMARSLSKQNFNIEWPNQFQNYAAAKLDDCMGELKRSFEMLNNEEEEKLEGDPTEQLSLFIESTNEPVEIREVDSSFEDAFENLFRQMCVEEPEPVLDSSCDNLSTASSSCK